MHLPAQKKTQPSTLSRRSSLLAIIAVLTVGLSACDPSVKLLTPDDLYPSVLTSCKAEPIVPDRPAPDQPRLDPVKAQYVADLRASWADCHDAVDAVAKRKADYTVQYNKVSHKLF